MKTLLQAQGDLNLDKGLNDGEVDGDKLAESEFEDFLNLLFHDYCHDFRQYALASLQRRVIYAMRRLHCRSLSELRIWLSGAPDRMPALLQYLTVSVTEMFRDPPYFQVVRQQVIPLLRNLAAPKIWVAGCSTGEEAWSLAIILREEGLLDNSLIYATDINPFALKQAERGIFSTDKLRLYTENYQQAGGLTAFSNYYHVAYDHAVFDRSLRRRIVFTEHSLATDSVFSETDFISCRNVLIYFNTDLQARAISLFIDSLSPKGVLGLGSRENLSYSLHAGKFYSFAKTVRIYQIKDEFSDTGSVQMPERATI